jgi:hypothetical protein
MNDNSKEKISCEIFQAFLPCTWMFSKNQENVKKIAFPLRDSTWSSTGYNSDALTFP